MRDTDPDAETRGSQNDACACGDATEESTGVSGTTVDRWPGDAPVMDAELPWEVQCGLGRVLGEPPVETLDDWTSEVRRRSGGGSITADDLCHASEETGHRGEVNGATHHFVCFLDAVVLSALTETRVDVRTESPGGAAIDVRVVGTADLAVTPRDAVFSFGIDEGVEPPPDGEPSRADVYAAVCPYVRAFPDTPAYDRWARRASAATVAMPLAAATEVAAALVE